MLTVLLVVAVFAALLFPLWRLHDLRGTHHAYYGLALLALGYGLWRLPGPWRLLALPCVVGGAWCYGDDLYQHVRQLWQPAYRSSLHRWFARALYPSPVVRQLTGWLDQLFGKNAGG